MNQRRSLAWTGLLMSSLSQAHHSIAMFDLSKYVTVDGTVLKFEWTNPHVWLWVTVPGPDGTTQNLGIESGAPAQLRDNGLRWNSFKEGDRVKVTIHPMKGGRSGGQLVSAVLADGTLFKSHDPAADAPPPGQGAATP